MRAHKHTPSILKHVTRVGRTGARRPLSLKHVTHVGRTGARRPLSTDAHGNTRVYNTFLQWHLPLVCSTPQTLHDRFPAPGALHAALAHGCRSLRQPADVRRWRCPPGAGTTRPGSSANRETIPTRGSSDPTPRLPRLSAQTTAPPRAAPMKTTPRSQSAPRVPNPWPMHGHGPAYVHAIYKRSANFISAN